MKVFQIAFVSALLVFSVVLAYDDEVTGECGKDWEEWPADNSEIKMAAEFAAHANSQVTGATNQDILVRVSRAFIKDCRWPKYNITGTFGISTCRVGEFRDDCERMPNTPLRECNVFLWIPPGKGGKLERFECTEVQG